MYISYCALLTCFFHLLAVFFSTALVGAVPHNVTSYAVHESLADVTGETIVGDISGSVSIKVPK